MATEDEEDFRLLSAFAAGGYEPAFARLVARHVDVVHGVCLRRLRDPAAAADAAQQVFVTLARRAAAIRPGTAVAGWLYLAAVNEAARAARAVATRRRHEMAAARLRAEAADEPAIASGDHEVGEAIDRALCRLRGPERTAVILRYLQGRSLAEVARELRTTEEAARKRVSRGLDGLRRLLRPRGVTAAAFPVAAVERALASAATGRAPASVAAAAARAAAVAPKVVGAAGLTSPLKAAAVALATAKATTTAVAVAAVLLVAVGGGVVVYRATGSAADPAPLTGRLASVVRPPASQQTIVLGGPPAPQPYPADASWRPAIERAYGLGQGQVLKQVLSPPVPERAAFCRATIPMFQTPASVPPLTAGDRFVFEWDGPTASAQWSGMFQSDPAVLGLLTSIAHVDVWDADPDSVPIGMRMPGDWVVRRGSTDRQRMDALAAILSTRIGRPVRFERRTVPRDVIVVSGTYRYAPLPGMPGDGSTVLRGTQIDSAAWEQRVDPNTLAYLLDALAMMKDEPIVDDAGVRGQRVTFRSMSQQFDDADLMTADLAHQTGLTFTPTRRPVDSWVLVDPAGRVTSAVPATFQRRYAPGPGEAVRRVVPPFGPDRQAFWDVIGGEGGVPPSLLLEADDGRLRRSPAGDVRTVAAMFDAVLHVHAWELDETVPADAKLPAGDLVVRADATAEQRVAALGPIVSAAVGRPVHFELRTADRDVVVARGRAEPMTAGGSAIEFFEPNTPVAAAPPERTPSDRFLRDKLPAALNCRVVDETTGPAAPVAWRPAVSRSTTPSRDAMLQQVSNGTGLQMTVERRPVATWTLVDGPAGAPAPR